MIENRFKSVYLPSELRECLLEALEYFPDEDFSDVRVNLDVSHDPWGAAYIHGSKTLEVGYGLLDEASHRDVVFILAHELRHAVQGARGMITCDDSGKFGVVTWLDGTSMNMLRLNIMIEDDIDSYQQLPWEADANGFAHYAMGGYVPEHPILALGVKYCTRPEEFL